MPDTPVSNKGYRCHNWKIYTFRGDELSSAALPIEADGLRDFIVCFSDSPRAETHRGSQRLFHPDLEVESVGLPRHQVSGVLRLTEPWKGHAAGALVILSLDQKSLDQETESKRKPGDWIERTVFHVLIEV